jgi:starvation-inducible DNA-binding protein
MTTPFGGSVALPEESRSELVRLLNVLLANSIDLYTQAKHAHWNVKGDQFQGLHRLFDEIADHLRKHSDLLAERAAALGGSSWGPPAWRPNGRRFQSSRGGR